jgi:hypothetical protein
VPYEAKAYLTTGQGGEKYAVSGTFDDQEWKALLEFVQYAKGPPSRPVSNSRWTRKAEPQLHCRVWAVLFS